MCLRVKYLLFLPNCNGTYIYRQIFEKYSHMNFHENPFSGSRVVQCVQTDGQTDGMTKLKVAFRIFSNAHKIGSISLLQKTQVWKWLSNEREWFYKGLRPFQQVSYRYLTVRACACVYARPRTRVCVCVCEFVSI
jgi:hypothetical protein